jgi:hypothetical protein
MKYIPVYQLSKKAGDEKKQKYFVHKVYKMIREHDLIEGQDYILETTKRILVREDLI